MKPFGLSANALANAIGVTAARVNEIANERRGITADTALRLATYFGTDARSWMNLQKNYELERARRELAAELKHIRPRAA
jgi:addiction module HigA family antidote